MVKTLFLKVEFLGDLHNMTTIISGNSMGHSFFYKYLIGLVFFNFMLLGCKPFYNTTYGEYRPKNPRFDLRPDLADLRRLDSLPFEVVKVYSADLFNLTNKRTDWRLVLSSDGRACSYIDTTEFYGDKLRILPEIWINSPQIGFYKAVSDTLIVEIFTPVEFGQYIEIRGVIDEEENFKVFKQLRGGRRGLKWNEHTQGVDFYRRVDWVEF